MINKMRKIYKAIYLKHLIRYGLKVGQNFQMEKGCNIDANFPWLIEIGNNVTMASWVYIAAHDGASKNLLGYSRVGRVKVGNNVFIGTKSIIMPGVTIGQNSIIGANSVVTTNVPANSVVAGVPAKIICDIKTYKEKLIKRKELQPVFDSKYTLRGGITREKKEEMIEKLTVSSGFII